MLKRQSGSMCQDERLRRVAEALRRKINDSSITSGAQKFLATDVRRYLRFVFVCDLSFLLVIETLLASLIPQVEWRLSHQKAFTTEHETHRCTSALE